MHRFEEDETYFNHVDYQYEWTNYWGQVTIVWNIVMDDSTILGVITLNILCLLGWVSGVFRHRACKPDSDDAINLPGFLAILFWTKKTADIRGLVLQILVVAIDITYNMYLFGRMTMQEVRNWLFPIIVLLVLIGLIHAYAYDR